MLNYSEILEQSYTNTISNILYVPNSLIEGKKELVCLVWYDKCSTPIKTIRFDNINRIFIQNTWLLLNNVLF